MRLVLKLAVLALSLFSVPSLPQEAPTTGSIDGTVIRSDTEQPIANAQVTLSQASTQAAVPATAAAGAVATATTGSDGKFVFKDIVPAAYRVAATAPGFVRQEYGQRALNGSGRLLFVVAGQPINDAHIRMTPTGTISGRILDENGQPAVGVPVELLRSFNDLQGRTYRPAGSAAADDRGQYRIFGLAPGRYYLAAGTQPTVIGLSPAALRGGLPGRPARYSMVYYPNVSKVDEATAIEVKAGNESSADMRLKRETQTFHVRGRVINPTGGPFPPDLTVTLGFTTLTSYGGSPRANSFDPATGTFDVPDVPAGEFTLQIIPPPQGPRGRGTGTPILDQQAQRGMGLAASALIHVTNADIDGLVLTLTPAVTVQGQFIVEGQPISAVPNLSQLRLNIRSALLPVGLGMPVASSTIAPDGSFQVVGLREEGEYRAQMGVNVPGFYVKSLKYSGENILGRTFKIRAGDSGSFEVVLKAATQSIAGTVTDAKSQPVPGIAVALIPAQRERVDLFRTAYTDQTGKFTITNIAAEEYKVFSWEAAATNAYMDPDFLKQYEQLGKTVSVTESSNTSVDVKLIPAQ